MFYMGDRHTGPYNKGIRLRTAHPLLRPRIQPLQIIAR